MHFHCLYKGARTHILVYLISWEYIFKTLWKSCFSYFAMQGLLWVGYIILTMMHAILAEILLNLVVSWNQSLVIYDASFQYLFSRVMVLWQSNIFQFLRKQVIKNIKFVHLVYQIPKYIKLKQEMCSFNIVIEHTVNLQALIPSSISSFVFSVFILLICICTLLLNWTVCCSLHLSRSDLRQTKTQHTKTALRERLVSH